MRYGFESQRFLEAGLASKDLLPQYRSWAWASNLLSADNITLDVHKFSLLYDQNLKGVLDGTLGLGNVRDEVWYFDGAWKYNGISDRPRGYVAPLPIGINDRSWFSYRAFSVSFADEQNALLQFGVNDTHGDATLYDGVLSWFGSDNGVRRLKRDTLRPEQLYDAWFVKFSNITIGNETFGLSNYDLEKQDASGAIDLTAAARDFVLQKYNNIEHRMNINGRAILNTVSNFTRLHPWVVYELYQRIPGSRSYNSTWYLPCDFALSGQGFPEIQLHAEDIYGTKQSFTLAEHWDFPILSHRHPQRGSLCAGAIQSIYPMDKRWRFENFNAARPPNDDVYGFLGRSFFRRNYVVFKGGLPEESNPNKLIGVASVSRKMQKGYGRRY
ncbi:hypothetical protein TWF481_003063 [Arthrobotrys musiformis]|uniref:Uncharacterized protein n=1 Tax=Arthrobotrys musiformis TaxID=47236 RepID=A0AAV9VRR0_9PEZI